MEQAIGRPVGFPTYDDDSLRRILRNDKFGHLSESAFELLMATCQRRELDPWLEHFHAEVDRAGKLALIVKLDALRDRAESTDELRERVGPQWCGPDGKWLDAWTDRSAPPAVARVGIRRRGRRGVFWGIANWEAFAQWTYGPNGEQVCLHFWQTMGSHMLAKCAEAMGLRAAFPRRLAGLFTDDEMGQSRNPAPTRAVAVRAAYPVDDSAPTTPMSFELRLIHDFEMGNAAERQAATARMMKRFPGLYDEDPRAFWASALRELGAESRSQVVTA